MTPLKLTDHQLDFFKTFGFLSFPALLADQIDEIDSEFEAVWEARGGGHHGKPHEGKARSCIVPFIDQTARLCALLDDARILGIATSLLGDDFNYMGSDGNYYVGDTGWHSDGWHSNFLHIKIALYLDPLTRDTGAIRVIPGSHLPGDTYANALAEKVGKSQELWEAHGKDVPAVALETMLGDVVCFNHNTKHAAFGGSTRRRMFTINLCEQYPESQLDTFRGYISGHARYWVERVYGEIMVSTAGPERMRHLEQVMANDGHLAELARQAKETMTEPARG